MGDGVVAEPRFLPPLEETADIRPEDGASLEKGTIMPLFPLKGFFFLPYSTPPLVMEEVRLREQREPF